MSSSRAESDVLKLRSRTITKRSLRPSNTKTRGGRKTSGGGGGGVGKAKLVGDGDNKRVTGGRPAPRMRATLKDYEDQCRRCAVPSLKHYNSKLAPSLDGVTYKMIDLGKSCRFHSPKCGAGSKYHCNFTAKPQNSDSDDPPLLFFAEIWFSIHKSVPPVVVTCIRLGVAGSGEVATGRQGCNGCYKCKDLINHPADIKFDVGHPRHLYSTA